MKTSFKTAYRAARLHVPCECVSVAIENAAKMALFNRMKSQCLMTKHY